MRVVEIAEMPLYQQLRKVLIMCEKPVKNYVKVIPNRNVNNLCRS